jgi:hypothetical protein
MNGNEMSQQQRDAAVIQAMRDTLKQLEETPHWSFGQAMQYVSPPDLWWGSVLSCVLVALRTIDRQAAEIERLMTVIERDERLSQLRIDLDTACGEIDTLRTLLDGVPELMEMNANDHDRDFKGTSLYNGTHVAWLRSTARAIRAALASESD